MPRRVALLIVLTVTLPRSASAQAERWWSDVKALADDSMRGRETGSPEYRRAADYVASAFRAAGLTPAGTEGFLQPVSFTTRVVEESQSRLTLVSGGVTHSLVLGQDAIIMPRAANASELDAPVVFAGYGLDLPEYGHDDFAGLDLRGKVVAYLTGTPRGIPGPVLSHARSSAWLTFRARGAVGIVAFSPLRGGDSAWRRTIRSRFTPAFSLTDSAADPMGGSRLFVTMNAVRAEQLFAGAPERFAVLASRADSGLALPHFDLPVHIRSVVRMSERTVSAPNVAGVLPGSDPALRNEYVVLTAHLDHIGVGRPVDGDSINNGAMDNAAGAALLMDVARLLGRERAALRRSVLFLAVTGEEKGLLGARYFAAHPTVRATSIVADLNTDMFLPIIPFRMVMANGLEESDLAQDARSVGTALGVDVVTDPEPEENRFVRSDQYAFILRGVPALSLKVGFARDTPEHETVKAFRAKRYHMPSDDVSQPVDLETAAAFERYYVALVRAVARRSSRPAWLPDSYFRKFASERASTPGR